MLAVERVPRDEISSYGVIAPEPDAELGDGIYRVRDLVEKPPRDEAPSDLAIIGRYILTPDIFPALAATKSDRTGEIQLTNGLRELLKTRPIYACEVKGVRHDTGNKLGFLKAVVYFALRRPDLADKFAAYLRSLGLAGAGRQALSVTARLESLATCEPSSLDAGARRTRLPLVADVGLLVFAGFVASSLFSRRDLSALLGLARTPSDFSARRLSPPSRTCRRLRRRASFFGVVGDVPAGALELNRGRRHAACARGRRTSGTVSSGGSENFWITSNR